MVVINTFTDFLAKIDNVNHRERTEAILDWILKTFPNLKPEIKWNQPMFTDHGSYIIGFSTAKKHLAVAPEEVTIAKFSDQIKNSGYSHTKGLFRIGWEQEVDYKLLEEIIKFNIEDKLDTTTFWR